MLEIILAKRSSILENKVDRVKVKAAIAGEDPDDN